MRRAVLVLAGMFLATAVVVPGTGLAQSGKSIYDSKCAMCHGQSGQGDGPAAASFSPPPANFTSPSFWQGMTKDRIKNAIENGYKSMPAAGLSDSEAAAVIDYMMQAFKK